LDIQAKAGHVRPYFGQITWKALLSLEARKLCDAIVKIKKAKEL